MPETEDKTAPAPPEPPRVTEPAAPPAPAPQPVPQRAGAARESRRDVANKGKRFSEETVLSRARRLFRSEMKKIAKDAFGMEAYDEAEFKANLAELKKGREMGLSEGERAGARIQELEAQVIELKASLQGSVNEAQKFKRELAVAQREVDKVKTEYELKDIASSAGVQDLDYGLHLLRNHIKALPAGTEVTSETIKGYFEGLKKDPTKRAIFAEAQVAAGPKSLGQEVQTQTTAPQPGASQTTQALPNQGAPKPAEPGAPKPEVNALEMSKRDFNKHTREAYGFTPGMA